MQPVIIPFQTAQPPVIDYGQLGPILSYILLGLFMLKWVWDMVSPMINKKLGSSEDNPGGGLPADVDMRLMASQVAQLCESSSAIAKALLPMGRQIDTLHTWHNVNDEDGVKVWYIRRSFYEAIRKHNQELETLSLILRELVAEQKRMKESYESLRMDVRQLVRDVANAD